MLLFRFSKEYETDEENAGAGAGLCFPGRDWARVEGPALAILCVGLWG